MLLFEGWNEREKAAELKVCSVDDPRIEICLFGLAFLAKKHKEREQRQNKVFPFRF